MPRRCATCRGRARPEISTIWPSPALARAQRRNSRSISSSRPISGVSADPRNASNRLATTLGRSTCQAGTGAAMPLTSTAPRSRYSKRSPTSRRVPAAITTASGSAKACRRAARLGVSPTTDCSCAEPSPIRSPTTTSPVAIPTRAWSLTDLISRRLTASMSPALPGPPARRRPHAPADSRNKPGRRRPCIWRQSHRSSATISATAR